MQNADLEPTPDIKQWTPQLGFHKTNSTIVGGIVLRNGVLLPMVMFPRHRSKYSPHQGLRERVRRLKQQPPTTVDHTL